LFRQHHNAAFGLIYSINPHLALKQFELDSCPKTIAYVTPNLACSIYLWPRTTALQGLATFSDY